MAEATGSVADGFVGFLNVFVDPQATAKRVPSKLSWIWPVAVLVVGYLILAKLMLPYTLQFVDLSMQARQMPPDQLEQARSMSHMFATGMTYAGPLIGIGFLALFAWLIKVVYSLMDRRPAFRDVFSLLAACSVIPMLQMVANYVVLRMKNEPVESAEQMQPPFGLDIFTPGLHGPLFAFIHFFSIFEIWFLIVLVFGLAYMTRSSKLQALIASTPVWVLPLLLAMIGALFQPKTV